MTDAKTVWKFDAWLKFSEGGGGPRVCYVGHHDEDAARHLLMETYPGSKMDGKAEPISVNEAFAVVSRVFQDGEIYLVSQNSQAPARPEPMG